MPIVFLDFDDVICLNAPYGVYDLAAPVAPPDLHERLFAESCVDVLRAIDTEHVPEFVLTTSWLRLLDKGAFETLLNQCGLAFVARSLHPDWEAPPASGDTRAGAIDAWLRRNPDQQTYVILDDVLSGTGLVASPMASSAILCAIDEGLLPAYLDGVRRILRRTAPQ
jgi:hypothetical protein